MCALLARGWHIFAQPPQENTPASHGCACSVLQCACLLWLCSQEYVLQQSLHIPWLDKLTFSEINKLNKKHVCPPAPHFRR